MAAGGAGQRPLSSTYCYNLNVTKCGTKVPAGRRLGLQPGRGPSTRLPEAARKRHKTQYLRRNPAKQRPKPKDTKKKEKEAEKEKHEPRRLARGKVHVAVTTKMRDAVLAVGRHASIIQQLLMLLLLLLTLPWLPELLVSPCLLSAAATFPVMKGGGRLS